MDIHNTNFSLNLGTAPLGKLATSMSTQKKHYSEVKN